jgi:hypothetical protein
MALAVEAPPLALACSANLVPLAAIKDRKSYAASANGFASSIWHFAMTFATDLEVQLNG